MRGTALVEVRELLPHLHLLAFPVGPKVLFTGDTIARAPDDRVMLDVDLACFGHGGPATGVEVRAAR
ncbi:hypothetical protein [Actinoplanes sp. NPDC051494]|uniref:hypothetical protein n=1 Tax=Actinoplanes sp. NPDC051494 TaxID=3363907 RepID=UPI00378D8DF2